MLNLSNRRYTGAKTRLLQNIESALLTHCSKLLDSNSAFSFFDVFAGTGVVSEYLLHKGYFKELIINDFLYSNYAIYQAFFTQDSFDLAKLQILQSHFNNLENLAPNYYSKHFGDRFFSKLDSIKIGTIRDELDNLLQTQQINQKEFYVLLASLLYSTDKIANTVGHYDAYRKNVKLQDKFIFTLINPIKTQKKLQIFREDSNILAKKLKAQNIIAYIDPPYNSRQYSRFYHVLETLTQNTKPPLHGVAQKPEPQNLSDYSKDNAKVVFDDLITSLSKYAKFIVVSYNNTYNSKSSSSVNKMSFHQIKAILESHTKNKIHIHEIPYKAFSSGKTDFKQHCEYIFVCEL